MGPDACCDMTILSWCCPGDRHLGSAHFLDRIDPKYPQPRTDHHRGRRDERQPRPGFHRMTRLEESKCRVVPSAVPQHMKVARQVIEKKGDSMRLTGDR